LAIVPNPEAPALSAREHSAAWRSSRNDLARGAED
jgi:hypothetical protein